MKPTPSSFQIETNLDLRTKNSNTDRSNCELGNYGMDCPPQFFPRTFMVDGLSYQCFKLLLTGKTSLLVVSLYFWWLKYIFVLLVVEIQNDYLFLFCLGYFFPLFVCHSNLCRTYLIFIHGLSRNIIEVCQDKSLYEAHLVIYIFVQEQTVNAMNEELPRIQEQVYYGHINSHTDVLDKFLSESGYRRYNPQVRSQLLSRRLLSGILHTEVLAY